ncbi:MAG TPA: serine/threonine-protein kinase [Phycisphaerales bacterium]|nr:serine/threonine-protein kinase [Phycisphaerales bacterium]
MPDPPAMTDAEPSAVRALRGAWAAGRGRDALEQSLTTDALGDDALLAELLAADAEERWDRGEPATLEAYLPLVPALKTRAQACRALLMCELARRDDRSDPGIAERLKERFPELARHVDVVVSFFRSVGSGTLAASDRSLASLAPGDRLGVYELRERIGRGSFGEVWRAYDTSLRRQVALKLIPEPEDADPESLLGEARAAAALDHEGIVRVHAAGTFEGAGLIYIDTQLVADAAPTPDNPDAVTVGRSLEGIGVRPPGLPGREAARIVESACRAVAAAHARGVTHGDIKPGNLLMTPSGRVMVADFGLSVCAPRESAHDDPGRTVSLTTERGRVTGTPAYMSPEQARGERATPLSDVYSLGATLLALLAGRAPFAPRAGSARPSLDVIEQVRSSGPDLSGARAIDATLAAICARATAPRPEDRYVSASRMAEDLGAWLERRPTIARPLGAGGRVRLWARRNAVAAAFGTAAAALLVTVGVRHIVVVGEERDRALRAESDASDARDAAEAVNAFMRSVLGAANPRELGNEATVAQALELASARVATDLSDRPAVEAGARALIGATFLALGRLDDAERHLARAHALHTALSGEGSGHAIDALYDLATLRIEQARFGEAESMLRSVIEARTLAPGPDAAPTLRARADLGRLLSNLERFDEAEVELTHAASRLASAHGATHPDTLVARKDLATLHVMRRQIDLAEPELRAILADQERALGPTHPDTLVTLSDLARVLRLRGPESLGGAIALYQRALDGFRARQPPGHADRVITLVNLAAVLRAAERYEEASVAAREAAAEARIGFGDDHYYALVADTTLAASLIDSGRAEEARPLLDRARAALVEGFGEGHRYVLFVDSQLARLAPEGGDPDSGDR